MEIGAAQISGLGLLHHQWERLRPHILPNAGQLPTDFQPRTPSGDPKPAVSKFVGNVQFGRRRADSRELIPDVAIEALEPGRQHYRRGAVVVEYHCPIVEVLASIRLNEGMVEVSIGWVERVIDLNPPPAFSEVPPI